MEEQQINSDLADSIAMLEQILEVMPEDISALKALYNAYFQAGHRDKAFRYLEVLSDVACDTKDLETCAFAIQHLPGFEEEYPDSVAAKLAHLRLVDSSGSSGSAFAQSSGLSSASGDTDISAELALAWRLYEENQFSQEEYSSVLNDLTEVSSKKLDVPISVLHVLNDQGFARINRVMNYMSLRSSVPCISLFSFSLPEKVAGILSLDISSHDGALPFGFFGDDLLVAVLNPFNDVLMNKVKMSSGRRCHAFLVSPIDYDVALNKMREMEKDVTA